jgi:uncharacterized protein (DUF58 family)
VWRRRFTFAFTLALALAFAFAFADLTFALAFAFALALAFAFAFALGATVGRFAGASDEEQGKAGSSHQRFHHGRPRGVGFARDSRPRCLLVQS